MGKKFESSSWGPIDRPAFGRKCQTIDEQFNTLSLKRCEVLVPETGLFISPDYPMAHVKRQTNQSETLVRQMRLVIDYDHNTGLKRYLEQTLTKPLQFGRRPMDGFKYTIAPRADVAISKLVVNLQDLEQAVDLLIAEANRFYFLYCYPFV